MHMEKFDSQFLQVQKPLYLHFYLFSHLKLRPIILPRLVLEYLAQLIHLPASF